MKQKLIKNKNNSKHKITLLLHDFFGFVTKYMNFSLLKLYTRNLFNLNIFNKIQFLFGFVSQYNDSKRYFFVS